MKHLAYSSLATICLFSNASAGNWPAFRGPEANSVSTEERIPSEWGPDKNVRWKVKVPGVAWSSPIVWDKRIFVTTAITENQPRPTNSIFPPRRRPGEEGAGDGPDAKGDGPRGKRAEDKAGELKGRGEFGRGGGRARGPGGPGGRPGGYGRQKPPAAVYRWEVHCLERDTGKTLWSQRADEHPPSIPIHRTNTYASETPVTDGERVYAYFGMTGLYCYDRNGSPVWKKTIGSYPMMFGWGTGSSPVLAGDLLILQCDNEEKSFLVAFDKKTGAEAWRVARDEHSTWCTPFLWNNKDRTELVTGGSSKARSYDPKTGKLLWELGGISGRCAATPVGDADRVYFGTGGGPGVGPLVALEKGLSGSHKLDPAGKQDGVAWVAARGGPPMASPLLYRGYLYVLGQGSGILTVYDAKTGQVAYKERIPGASGFTASPWAAGDKVFALDGDGTTFVLAAGPKFELLGRNPLGEMCWASPALSAGMLFLRTIDHLYCFGE